MRFERIAASFLHGFYALEMMWLNIIIIAISVLRPHTVPALTWLTQVSKQAWLKLFCMFIGRGFDLHCHWSPSANVENHRSVVMLIVVVVDSREYSPNPGCSHVLARHSGQPLIPLHLVMLVRNDVCDIRKFEKDCRRALVHWNKKN